VRPSPQKNQDNVRATVGDPKKSEKKKPFGQTAGIILAAAAVVWWIIAAQSSWLRFVLEVGLSLASFMLGALAGFIFTSYDEEATTIGKVRDWLIGGMTGLTIGKAASIKVLLVTFTAGSGPNEFALTVSSAITFAILGFFCMFLQRELILNVLLARSRAERGEIEGTRQVGQVLRSFLIKLPPSILSGVDDISEIAAIKPEAERLRQSLYADEVNAFLKQADEDATQGNSLDWDTVSKVANIQYYRTYFETDKTAQAKRAVEWIMRALLMNPHHADLTMKHADALAMMEDYAGSVSILERLVRDNDAPVSVRQMLGFLLLYLPNRIPDAIAYSKQALELTGDNDANFNIACGYSQVFCHPERAQGLGTPAENHDRALKYLQDALKRDPDYVGTVKTKWTAKGQDFECFTNDAAFTNLISAIETTKTPSPSPPGGSEPPKT
jgi:tetratricopeptide (TPR) repeat protein